MITLDHLQKSYAGFHLDCTLSVRPGYVTGLIGRNGAGKSTTFKLLLGLTRPDGGSGTILDKPLDALTAADRQHIGVVLSEVIEEETGAAQAVFLQIAYYLFDAVFDFRFSLLVC